MGLETKDSLEYLKSKKDFEFDVNYSDPPYALGSEVVVKPNGKVDYKKANDFMNKWEMPTGAYWEEWFKEAFRTLKYGGYLVMFGMDRQLLLFKYYANLAGFTEQQSLYWYFISNFPKATDLSNMIAKRDGAKRDGAKRGGARSQGNTFPIKNTYQEYTKTDLAKKYKGYKYSISPLKQTNETIMVFKKPYKKKSCLHDTLAYENGDKECRCGALNIDGNRVPSEEELGRNNNVNPYGSDLSWSVSSTPPQNNVGQVEGRYPSQTFCDSNTAEVLDEQSGVSKSQTAIKINSGGKNFGSETLKPTSKNIGYTDTGGCSKILHKCDYEKGEMDLYIYNPKVSKKERNAGCDGRENKTYKINKNNHPTLKPIKLNDKILSLFKTPNDDEKIVYPFAGSGSEVIGGIKAGFKNWCGCEINQEYVDIANARIEYWKDKGYEEIIKSNDDEETEKSEDQTDIFDFMESKGE